MPSLRGCRRSPGCTPRCCASSATPIIGPSRILVLGPDSSLGPMIAATILPLVGRDGEPGACHRPGVDARATRRRDDDPRRRRQARLRCRPFLQADPDRLHDGSRPHDRRRPAPEALRLLRKADTLLGDLVGLVEGFSPREAVAAAAAVGVCSLVLIVVLQRWLPRVPGVLAAVVLSIVAAQAFDLGSHGVALVGTLPRGLPPFTLPRVPASDLARLAVGALGIALVALTDTISTASAFAARRGDQVRGEPGDDRHRGGERRSWALPRIPGEHEWVTDRGVRTGWREDPACGAGGRIGHRADARRRCPGCFRNLPQPTLAAVVIAAALSLADLPGMRRLSSCVALSSPSRRRPSSGWRSSACSPGSPSPSGSRSSMSSGARGGPTAPARPRPGASRATTTSGRTPMPSRPTASLILRFDAPLVLRQRTRVPRARRVARRRHPLTSVDRGGCRARSPTSTRRRPTCSSSWTGSSTTRDVSLVFAELKDPVRAKIDRYELTRTIDPSHFFPTIDVRGRRVRRQHRRRPQGRRRRSERRSTERWMSGI